MLNALSAASLQHFNSDTLLSRSERAEKLAKANAAKKFRSRFISSQRQAINIYSNYFPRISCTNSTLYLKG